MSWIGNLTKWFFFFPFRKCVTFLPRSQLKKISSITGFISFLVRRARKKIAVHELELLFGQALPINDLSRIVLRGFQLSQFILFESFCFPRITKINVGTWAQLTGEEHLENALKKGKGAIVVLVHFGANQMVMPALGYRGYRINQLGSRPEDWAKLTQATPSALQIRIFNILFQLEQSLPAHFIYIESTMKPVYSCLKSNEIVIMAVDGRAGTKFLKSSILNRTINLSAGPFRIAHAMGSPLIPVFPVSQKNGPHMVQIEPELCIPFELEKDTWIDYAVGEFCMRLKHQLLMHPDHYCMLMAEAKLRSHLDPEPLFIGDQHA
jgi:lauroyl/myristoyl acyltransferase